MRFFKNFVATCWFLNFFDFATPLSPSVSVSWTLSQSSASLSPSQMVSGHPRGPWPLTNMMFPPILTLTLEILLLWQSGWPNI